MIERNEGHYKVLKLPYGTDYVWCPRCVFVECDCGERLVLSASLPTCGCAADPAALVREELASRRPSEEVSRPLEDEYREWRNKHDEFLHSEVCDWVEWRALVRVTGEGEHRQKAFYYSGKLTTLSGVLCATRVAFDHLLSVDRGNLPNVGKESCEGPRFLRGFRLEEVGQQC